MSHTGLEWFLWRLVLLEPRQHCNNGQRNHRKIEHTSDLYLPSQSFLPFPPNKASPCTSEKHCLATLGCQDQPHYTACSPQQDINTRNRSYYIWFISIRSSCVFDSLKESVHKNHLFGNRATVISQNVFDSPSPKKKQLVKVFFSRIGRFAFDSL